MNTKVHPTFSSAARWIWGGNVGVEPSPKNDWRYFRASVDLPAKVNRATLLITADSAYELHVNGAFTGRGPVRSFPFAYAYDVYDVTPLLQVGANTLSLSNGTQVFSGSIQASGAGLVAFGGATATINGTYQVPKTTLTSGTATFAANVVLPAFAQSGASVLDGTGTVTVAEGPHARLVVTRR